MSESLTVRRRDKSKRVICTHCGKNIAMKQEIVRDNDRQPYHLLCAGLEHIEALAPCPNCFMVQPCLCQSV